MLIYLLSYYLCDDDGLLHIFKGFFVLWVVILCAHFAHSRQYIILYNKNDTMIMACAFTSKNPCVIFPQKYLLIIKINVFFGALLLLSMYSFYRHIDFIIQEKDYLLTRPVSYLRIIEEFWNFSVESELFSSL